MKTVIIFALACFPYTDPKYVTSSKRAAILAKHLPDFGWRTIVITYPWGKPIDSWKESYKNSLGTPSVIIPIDPGFHWAVRLQKQFRAFGTKYPLFRGVTKGLTLLLWLANWGIFDDEQAGWHREAIKVAKYICSVEQVDAAWATWGKGWGPLWTGMKTSNEMNIPWIADVRDDWNVLITRPLWLGKIKNDYMIKYIRNANMVTTVSQPLVELVKKKVSADVELIYNGFLNDLPESFEDPSPFFSIVYTGSIDDGRFESFRILCEAVKKISESSSNFIASSRFVYFGQDGEKVLNVLAEYDLADWGEDHGIVPYIETRSAQSNATILLILIPPESTQPGTMTAKIFDYLAARRPILSVRGNPNTINALLTKTDAGKWANTPDAVASILTDWFLEWENKSLLKFHGREEIINEYGPKAQMQKLASLLDGLVEKHRV